MAALFFLNLACQNAMEMGSWTESNGNQWSFTTYRSTLIIIVDTDGNQVVFIAERSCGNHGETVEAFVWRSTEQSGTHTFCDQTETTDISIPPFFKKMPLVPDTLRQAMRELFGRDDHSQRPAPMWSPAIY